MSDVRNIAESRFIRITGIIFILWGLTLPFAAKIGHFSLGFLTIYPNFILGVALLLLGMLSFPKWHRVAKAYFLFLVLWVVYAIVLPKLVGSAYHENWKFDMRSLAMQTLFAGVLIGAYYTLGKDLFLKRLRQGSAYLLLVVLIAGILEFYTGYHLRGQFTDKLFQEYTVTNIYYTPLFIYDNANDYMVYLIMLSLLYFALNYRETEGNIWQVATVMTIVFLFAYTASSRLAMFVIVGIFALLLVRYFWNFVVEHWKVWLWPTVAGIGFTCLLCWSNPMFVGPKYTKYNYTSKGEYLHLPRSLPTVGMSSDDVRKGLINNGIEFIKEQPVLGIGPGEFRQRHATGKVVHAAGTVVGPHNFPIELISQYGLIGWMCGFIWLALLVFIWKQFRRKQVNIWTVLLIPAMAVCSLMPSGFLYLDIHWMIIPVILLMGLQGSGHSMAKNE